jgi:exodeoxyribonuclease V alpha subunit
MKEEASGEAEVLRGTIDRVTFRNASNGYSVLQVILEGSQDRVTAVGTVPSAGVGSYVTMTGAFITHPKFGKQFTLHSLK